MNIMARNLIAAIAFEKSIRVVVSNIERGFKILSIFIFLIDLLSKSKFDHLMGASVSLA
jgi:hypothetical protein